MYISYIMYIFQPALFRDNTLIYHACLSDLPPCLWLVSVFLFLQ